MSVEFIRGLIDSLMPLLVAVTTALGAISVAKVQKVQKDIKTNHGTKGIGDATDIIRDKVDHIEKTVDDIKEKSAVVEIRVKSLESAKKKVYSRLDLEHTGPIQVFEPERRRRWWNRSSR